ncbi:Werner Syndrome-like exonuclease isoform X1 [Papaver somniferum]|uniref:Werner Syndrome-like exonuclease isoform X1 n=1 Tax=Papaver somniferum TaxID=3469 RepID=UPI000E6FDFD9|nr:Werner Syndrome-like exonuclease isoform X1 [Papaver somniferum]
MDAISDWERPFSQQELDEIDAVIASVTPQIKPHNDINRVPLNNRRLPNWGIHNCTNRNAGSFSGSSSNPRNQVSNKVEYPEMKFGGRIVYSKTVSEVEKAAKELLEIIEVKKIYMEQVSLGFDIEWKPTFRKGGKTVKAAVMQICGDPGLCYVMHIHHSGIPPVLQSLLEDPTSVKVGVAIGGDAVKVFKDYNVCVKSLEDLSDLANIKLGGMPKMWGLRSLAETLVHKQIKKPGNTRLSNWETYVLSKQQLEYAALDAFASWHLYQVLRSLPDAVDNNVAEEVNDSSPS